MLKTVYIGADGGGTHTSLIAVDSLGNILGGADGGGINFNAVGVEKARAELKKAVDALRRKVGIGGEFFLSVGSSALDAFASPELLSTFCGDVFDKDRTFLCSDAVAALYGLTFGLPGIILISGTGMMGAALSSEKKLILSGGLGYLLNDEGSCYATGHAGVLAALRYIEKVGPATLLSERLLGFYGFSDYRDFVLSLYKRKNVNAYIASFAKEVFKAAREGDGESRRITEDTLSALFSHAEKLLREINYETSVIGVYGGLFEKNPDIFERFSEIVFKKYPEIEVKIPEVPPEAGAVFCALDNLRPSGWKKTAELIKKRFVR